MTAPKTKSEDDAMLDSIVSLSRDELSMERMTPVWEAMKTSRGHGFAQSAATLLQVARSAPGSFDLREALRAILQHHPPVAEVRQAQRRRDCSIAFIAVIAVSTLAATFLRRDQMGEWAITIVKITGVPGLALLVLYFFAKPITDKLGLSKIGVKATERLVLILAVGLLLITLVAVLIYQVPEMLRAYQEMGPTKAQSQSS